MWWLRGWARGRPLFVCLAALGLVAVACGGPEARSEGVASVSEGTGAARGRGQTKGEQRAKDPEQAMLDFARCMRDHGVDMPDPEPGGRGGLRFAAPAAGRELPDQSTFAEAEKTCRHLMGDAAPPELSPEDRKAVQDAMLAFARCMREHGIDTPDPQPGGGGIVIRGGPGQGPDPRSPEFRAAEKECRKHTEAIDKKLGVERSDG